MRALEKGKTDSGRKKNQTLKKKKKEGNIGRSLRGKKNAFQGRVEKEARGVRGTKN